MAIHEDELSMLRESLPEFLLLAAIGLETEKSEGGALEYPSALLLMTIVDALGSYYRGNEAFTVIVDGSERAIRNDSEHVFVLNSRLFGYVLTGKQLERIYRVCRSSLAHHALIGDEIILAMEVPKGDAFKPLGDEGLMVVLPQLLVDCEEAIQRFMDEADAIVPNSTAVADLQKKSALRMERAKAIAAKAKVDSKHNGGRHA